MFREDIQLSGIPRKVRWFRMCLGGKGCVVLDCLDELLDFVDFGM